MFSQDRPKAQTNPRASKAAWQTKAGRLRCSTGGLETEHMKLTDAVVLVVVGFAVLAGVGYCEQHQHGAGSDSADSISAVRAKLIGTFVSMYGFIAARTAKESY
jgi:hypothetical protein